MRHEASLDFHYFNYRVSYKFKFLLAWNEGRAGCDNIVHMLILI